MKYDCFIIQAYNLKISQNLIGLKSADESDIKEIYSHPQAIAQSSSYLKKLKAEVIPYPNTAMAAKHVSQSNDPQKAAIASKETAEIYNLKVLAADINTTAENSTRFIVISKNQSSKGSRFSLFFFVKHNAGQLAKIINIIAQYGYNMENLRSRPYKDKPWHYYFYTEIDGCLNDEKTKQMIDEIKDNCSGIKLLGSYDLVN